MMRVLLLAAWMPVLLAGPAQELVQQGNAAWQAKRYEVALRLYQQALALRPESPEALYNLGTALYRMGDFPRALESFDRAARLGRRQRLEALARYNAGNSAFQQGLSLVYSDPRSALNMMEQALACYRETLRLHAGMRDANHNAEVVRKWLRLLEQHLSQQKQGGSGPPLPGHGPDPSVLSILNGDRGIRSGTGSRSRPLAVEKDW